MVEQTLWFKTEPIEPIVKNPSPADGEREVPLNLSSLHFTLKDFQGDAMSYTVESSPDIGSGNGTNVHNGTYTIPVNGLTYGTTYQWYVNVTDGAHETHKMFSFTTGYPALFNPFDYGFQYRKQITIDHTKVADDLTNFTILLSTIDDDLHQKAQDDGGDILFMNDVGVASKFYHEVENYDPSTGELIAWIKIPFLSSTNDTIFYMYLRKPHLRRYPVSSKNLGFELQCSLAYERRYHLNHQRQCITP